MIGLRLTVAPPLVGQVIVLLEQTPGVAHISHLPGAGLRPVGDLILCDVVRESGNQVVEALQDLGVHRSGAIAVEILEAAVSDSAQAAEAAAPGQGEDALVWEEVESKARSGARLTVSFLCFMAIAAAIASVGILVDSPILIVGAMVVGPEYGPLAALCVAAARRRPRPVLEAGTSLAVGLATATALAFGATLIFRVTGLAPAGYGLSDRQLTAFISHPDGMTAVVALLAGIAGMLSLTEGKSGALVGVLVSVTTIPAAANVGVAAAYAEWSEVRGAAFQLMVNLAGLLIAGVGTLLVQARLTTHRAGDQAEPSGPLLREGL